MKTKHSTLDIIRTRPRFKIIADISKNDFAEHLKIYVKNDSNLKAEIHSENALIWINTQKRPFWKPILALRAEDEDAYLTIRGIFGPSAAVWTFFVFMYLILSVLWMVFITLWFVGNQIQSDGFTWGLPSSFVVLAALSIVYIANKIGQKKAREEMTQLRDFVVLSTLQLEKEELKKDSNEI